MKLCKELKGTANSILIYAKKGKHTHRHIYINVAHAFDCLSYRNLMGEDLGPLSSKELESLERQLDMSLKQIRSIRVHKPTALIIIFI